MPGPANHRKKKKAHGQRKAPKVQSQTVPVHSSLGTHAEGLQNPYDEEAYYNIPTKGTPDPVIARLEALSALSLLPHTHPPPQPRSLTSSPHLSPPAPSHNALSSLSSPESLHFSDEDHPDSYSDPLPPPPLTDPGTGPRINSLPAFLSSSFVQPPSSNALSAEFAGPEVLQMLRTVLPEETAFFAQYNKSRQTSRICPACRRLYTLGAALSAPLPGHDAAEDDLDSAAPEKLKPPSPQLLREQEISGLCSPLCFILALSSQTSQTIYPSIIRACWGSMAEDLDDDTWAILNASLPSRTSHSPAYRESSDVTNGEEGHSKDKELGLGLLVTMTRLHDLGLAQLCVPEIGLDEEIYEAQEGEGAKELEVGFTNGFNHLCNTGVVSVSA